MRKWASDRSLLSLGCTSGGVDFGQTLEGVWVGNHCLGSSMSDFPIEAVTPRSKIATRTLVLHRAFHDGGVPHGQGGNSHVSRTNDWKGAG